MGNRKKILLVEDDKRYSKSIVQLLERRSIEVILAETLEDGERCYRDNSDIDLVIMDACVPGDRPNSMPLIRKILERGFSGPIVAASSLSFFNDVLMKAGATHKSPKYEVADFVVNLLGLDFRSSF